MPKSPLPSGVAQAGEDRPARGGVLSAPGCSGSRGGVRGAVKLMQETRSGLWKLEHRLLCDLIGLRSAGDRPNFSDVRDSSRGKASTAEDMRDSSRGNVSKAEDMRDS